MDRPDVVSLHRSIYGRLVYGPVLHPLLSIAVVPATLGVVKRVDGGGTAAVVEGLVLLAAVCVWVLGLTAHAEVGEAGVSWRFYRAVLVPWSEIAEVDLTWKATGVNQWRARIRLVRRGGRRRTVPLVVAGWAPDQAFARAVVDRARTRGVHVASAWPGDLAGA